MVLTSVVPLGARAETQKLVDPHMGSDSYQKHKWNVDVEVIGMLPVDPYQKH